MSSSPLGGIVPGAAGAPFAKRQGSEVERSAQENSAQERKVDSDNKADSAAGIGTTEEDSGTDDRDADGRRLWEEPESEDSGSDDVDPATDHVTKRSKDTTGESGNQLDLSG